MSAGAVWLLAAGLWAGAAMRLPWWGVLLGLAVAAGATRVPARLRLALLVCAALLVGGGLAGGRAALVDAGSLVAVAHAGGERPMAGVVVTEPRESEAGTWFVVRVHTLGGARIRERALVRLGDRQDPPAIGQHIALVASARPLGDEGFDRHVRGLHAGVALTPRRVEVVGDAGWVLRTTGVVRARTRAAIDQRLDPDRASLLAGLVLGDDSGRTPQMRDRFAAAGLSHLVVVSGRHVAVLLAAVLAVAAALGAGARARGVAGLLALAWFVVLVRWQPSVLRAGSMAGLVLGSRLLGRGADVRHALAAAVILLLLADPFLSRQMGFALSVAATAGVLVLAPRLARQLPGPRWLRLPVALTVGAQVGAAPVLLQLQDGLPLLAIPANVVAVPAAGMAQLIGLGAGGIAQVWPGGGALVAQTAVPFLSIVLWSAERFATGPLLRPEHLMAPVALLLLAGLVSRRRAPAAAVAAIVLSAVLWAWPAAPPPPVGVLTLTALDVGQGDALLVEMPGAAGTVRMLVDGGPETDGAAAQLRRRGIRRLDVVALSHPHHDHSGGLPAVLRELEVGTLLVGPTPLRPGDGLAPSAIETHLTARERGVPALSAAAGQRFTLGRGWVEVLSPPADGSLAHDLNEDSLVLRVTDVHGSLLLTGDAEEAAQLRLLRDPGRVRASVLKVPHHGGRTNAPGFLEAVGASVAVIGVGAGNDYGHPARAVLEELAGAPVYRTDLHGRVTVALTAGGPVVEVERTAVDADAAGTAASRQAGGRRGLISSTPRWLRPSPVMPPL
jgi:competence protein ComEC